MASNRKQLEELFIALVLEDKKLEAQYRQVVERAKTVAREIQAAITGALGADLIDDRALNQSFDAITQKTNAMAAAAREASQAVKQVGAAQREGLEENRQASEAANKVLNDMINQAQRAFDQIRKAGEITTQEFDEYRTTALETADSLASAAKAAGFTGDGFEKLKAHVRAATYEQNEAVKTAAENERAQKLLDEAIGGLSARVATQRNLWAARVTEDEQFTQSTQALKDELLKLVDVGELTDQQMRKITQAAAYAQRGLDSANKVASRGGLAWTTQIALANQFEQQLRGLGPAGEVAAGALGIVSKELQALMQVDPSRVVSTILGGFAKLGGAVVLAAGAAVAGVAAALFKMGTAAAESAEKLTTAATRASLTVEAFQEYAFAAEQSGVQVEVLTTTLQRLQRRAVDAQAGNQGLRDSFDKLGVTLVDAQGKMLSTGELFGQVADGLVGIEGDAERVALAFKIFDTEGAKLLPMLQRGSAGIQEMRDKARELGLVISKDAVMSLVEFKNKVNEAQKQLETSKIEIIAGFMPTFTNLLIPLIQNTVVPWFQTLAARVNEFSQALRDTGPAGVEFRNGIAQALAPIVSIVGYVQAAGASLDILNYKFQLNGAQMNAFWRQQANEIKNLPEAVKRFFGLSDTGPASQSGGRDSSGFNEANIRDLEAALAAADARLADAIYKINNPGAITAEWLDALVEQVSAGTSSFTGLGDAASDAYEEALNPPPPPTGSLAALRAQLQAAQREFELAVTDEARNASLIRIGLVQVEIDEIERMRAKADPLAAARAWTGRLTAEMREGVKGSVEVFDLLVAGIDRMREEASGVFDEFGWDSAEYRDAVQKLEFLEAFLRSLNVETEALDGITMRGLQGELQALITQGFEPTSEAVKDLLRQMNELELRGALEELRSKGVANLSDWARGILQANGLIAEAVRMVPFTAPQAFSGILDEPLARTRLRIHQFSASTSADLGVARDSWDDFARGVALGAASVESALNAPTEAFLIFQDTILQMMQSGADMREVYDAIARSPFSGAFNLMGFGEGPDPQKQVGLIKAAYAAQAAAFEALQTAMTEDAIAAAGERYNAAQEEVSRLEALYATPVDVTSLGEGVREKVVSDLAAAGVAAQAFGTESALAAKQLAILEGAIMTLLQADPSAYIADLQAMWESIRGGASGATEGVADLTLVTKDLEAAQERLKQLTSDAPSEFDKLRDAFQNAANAGLITNDVLREMLELLGLLEKQAESTAKLQQAASDINMGTLIGTGLTGALEGLRDGNLDSVLGGLTDIGVAIGTLIGGPAVGAIVGEIGKAIQALPALFQVVSDLFTGDSPARRKLRDGLASTVAGAFHSGIIEGLRGADDWQENLRTGVQEAVLGALIDAFIQATVMQAIFAPFIDEFTRVLNQSGVDAAFAFFDSKFEGFWSAAMDVVEGFVSRGQQYFRQAEGVNNPAKDPLKPITFELPNATVGVLAAPQWALELGTAAERMNQAGDQMVIAAQMMQSTFLQGIPVTSQSTRGIDAQRAL